PDDPFITTLITRMGRPLAVTSANLSGHPETRDHISVIKQLESRVDLVVEGSCPTEVPVSSVLDVSVDPFRLLREGAVSHQELANFLPPGRLSSPTSD